MYSLFLTTIFFLSLSIRRELTLSSIARNSEKCMAPPLRIPSCADVRNVVVYTYHTVREIHISHSEGEKKRAKLDTAERISISNAFLLDVASISASWMC